MAYDGYRNHSSSHSESLHNQYSDPYDPTHNPQSFYTSSYRPPGHYPHDPPSPGSHASSHGRSEGSQQPLNDALRHAFDQSDAARRVDPDLIAEITAQVKRSVLEEIKQSGMGVNHPSQSQSSPPPQQHVPHSPTSTSTSLPSRNVYTPPSPHRQEFASPDPYAAEAPAPGSMYDGAAEEAGRYGGGRSADPPSRPPPAQRMSTEEITPIEKKWQRLFDADGIPTPRLGQFLRGLARHLIEDYEPKNSLVVTPPKMLKFYEEVKIAEEVYPWSIIFGKLPLVTLSKIYREMRCQYHLVQDANGEAPHVPALTPEGFEEWMTVMIQAYPDAEFQRLSKAVLHLPISNADDVQERFPKELPRRLFPTQEHLHAQQRCAAILAAEGVGPLRRAPTFPPPPPKGNQNPSPSHFDPPYGGPSDSVAVESDHEEPPAIQIERERKPYIATPGGGKIHEEGTHLPRHRAQSSATGQAHWVPPPDPSYDYPERHRRNSHANRRRTSPGPSHYGTRSDSNVNDIPPYYEAGNMNDAEEQNRRFARDAEKKRNEWSRRNADDDASGVPRYSAQSRSQYDEDYYRGRGGSGYDNGGYESRRY